MTRISLAAPQPAVGNVGGRAGGLSVVGPFTETAGGGGGGRQQGQELKPWKDAGFDKEEVLQDFRECIPARPHLHPLCSMLGSCASGRRSEVLHESLVFSVHDPVRARNCPGSREER